VLNVAGLVTDILQAAPGVRVLTTSRERLNLQAETLVRIKGMDFPEEEMPPNALEYSAVKLFIQSAQRARPDFALVADETHAERIGRLMQSAQQGPPRFTFAAEDLAYVARICRQVRGMPLGIVLAAAWVEMLSPEEISREISQSLDFLETEMRNVPDRHRSIRAVFESSWRQLSEAEQMLFKQLSVFQGGFTREPVMNEDVILAVGIIGDEVVGQRIECHAMMVRDGAAVAVIVCLHTAGVYARSMELFGPQVLHEDICIFVGVIGHQVVGVGIEGHVPAVR